MKATKPMLEIKPRLTGLNKVAQICGVSAVHVRYILKGERRPSGRLRDALRACGVTKRLDGKRI